MSPASLSCLLATLAADVRLVASGDLVAVLEEAEVRVFSQDGRLLTRLPGAPEPPPPEATARTEGEALREGIFDLHDIPLELRDSPEAEDLLDDELPLSARRAPPGSAGDLGYQPGRALAAADGAGGVWLARGRHLTRIAPARGTIRLASLPVAPGAMAAAAGVLVLATPGGLRVSADGGHGLRTLVGLERAAIHLAAHPALRWIAWSDGSGVRAWRGSGVERVAVLGDVHALASCGGGLVVLTSAGLYVGNGDGPPVRVSEPLPAATMSCPPSGPGAWLFAGDGLLESIDGGQSFRPRADAPPGPLRAVAQAGDRIWVASVDGIHLLGAEPAPVLARALSGELATGVLAPATPGWAAWLAPRLTMTASYQRTARRRDWRALALAEVPLGGADPALRYPTLQVRRAALTDPTGAEQVSPHAPAPPYPFAPSSPLVSPPLAPRFTYPPRDPDAACLLATRTRAVALAQAEAERARSLVVRAGRAAWLPELRLLAQRRLGRSESLDVRTSASTTTRDALGLDASNDVRYEVRATWDLPRLIFSPEEVAAVQQGLRIADMRREIEAQVNRVYFERRRLLVNPAGDPPIEATGALLRVEELEAELDALSGSEFSRCRAIGASRLGP